MPHLAISLYPEKSTFQEMETYIKEAEKANAKRIFSCLLSAKKDKETVFKEYKALCDLAHAHGMKVILDTSRTVFNDLQIPLDDLSFFKDMHVDGIRLDDGFTPEQIAKLTMNPEGLIIEINASLPDLLRDISRFPHNRDALQASHNFYPQKYTGLGLEYFKACNDILDYFGLDTGAFISSQNKDAHGPWPVKEGLCTLESCRDLPVEEQARILLNAGMEEIIIANEPATPQELEKLSHLFKNEIVYYPDKRTSPELLDAIEQENILRSDQSDYVIRFAKRLDTDIEPNNTGDIEPGDVLVLNNLYPKYAGEIQIALRPMPNDGRKNIVGGLDPENLEDIDFTYPVKLERQKF